eukprot:TRINITY_DN28091_c0_g1_i1.p1 TRINITY_DN28091_c0_g1~~TRINITY_DN28091_c0_g1_i1.p1  ORF type:complete len:234 (-),score=33.72 TRINITY_DN28091_c0_g1_i1:150-824(-)
MAYRTDKAQPRFSGPDPLRRLPTSQSQGALRRQGLEGYLPPSAARRPHRPAQVPPVALQQAKLAFGVHTDAEEILQIGCWSVLRPTSPNARPIFVNVTTGIAQEEPPEEILRELATGSEGQPEQPCQQLAAGDSNYGPKFRRVVLGRHHEMPLRMARDILAALRDDASLFDQVQARFSDTAAEPALELGALPKELQEVASMLAPDELSEVVATESGMQVLIRVS